MNVAIISANLGNYDHQTEWPDLHRFPGYKDRLTIRRFTDETLPPRPLAMTSRLQCGIPKWFGHEFVTADLYIWIDASCAPTDETVEFFEDYMDGGADVAVFAHPDRTTVGEEAGFVMARMLRKGETYLNSRYKGEWIEALAKKLADEHKAGLPLYASTAFAYRPRRRVKDAFAECFLLKARYLLHDQLAFPYVLDKHECVVNVIPDNYLKCPALTFTRKRK